MRERGRSIVCACCGCVFVTCVLGWVFGGCGVGCVLVLWVLCWLACCLSYYILLCCLGMCDGVDSVVWHLVAQWVVMYYMVASTVIVVQVYIRSPGFSPSIKPLG